MVLETTGKVGDATLAITRYIRNLSDVVEHVARGEEQNHDDANGSPEVAVLEEGENIGAGDGGEGDETEDGDGADDELHPVEGTVEGRGWGRGKMAREPVMDWFCAVCTVGDFISITALNEMYLSRHGSPSGKVKANRETIWLGVDTGGRREKKEDRSGLKHHLCILLECVFH